MKNKNLWLDEKNLYEDLKLIFKKDFIRNKTVPNSKCKYRPDFRNEELNLIVEFDGPRHYTDPKVIRKDEKENKIFNKMGYKMVRIPYYVQIETKIIKLLFNLDFEYKLKYPHGFNEKNVIIPAQFCELGIQRFKNELIFFSIIGNDIADTLLNKIEENEFDYSLVITNDLLYIIDPSIYRDIRRQDTDNSFLLEEILLKSLFYIEDDNTRKNFLNTFIKRKYYYNNSLFNSNDDSSYYLYEEISKDYKENIRESLDKDRDFDLYMDHINFYLKDEESYFNQIKKMLK